MTYGEEAAAPAAPQDEVAQLKAKVKELDKKIADIRRTITDTDEMKALKKKSEDASKAMGDAKKAKLDADGKYKVAAQAMDGAKTKLEGLGCNSKGQPKDAAKTLSDQEKTDAEVAVKAIGEAKAQMGAMEKELLATEEMKQLEQARKDASKAYEEGLKAKLDADPAMASLQKEKDELHAKIKAARAAPAAGGAGAGVREGTGTKVTFGGQ